MVDMEVDIPFDITPPPAPAPAPTARRSCPASGKRCTSAFRATTSCSATGIPSRIGLFKIHNSLNLQGVFQQLPLFDPPIDPALLVRAAAAGLDVSAIVSGLNQPLPLVRFQLLVSKAAEICQEVKSLGANLLARSRSRTTNPSLFCAPSTRSHSATGRDGEVLPVAGRSKATQALQLSLADAIQRYAYYQKMLGRTDAQIQSSIPQLDALDRQSAKPELSRNPMPPASRRWH